MELWDSLKQRCLHPGEKFGWEKISQIWNIKLFYLQIKKKHKDILSYLYQLSRDLLASSPGRIWHKIMTIIGTLQWVSGAKYCSVVLAEGVK